MGHNGKLLSGRINQGRRFFKERSLSMMKKGGGFSFLAVLFFKKIKQ